MIKIRISVRCCKVFIKKQCQKEQLRTLLLPFSAKKCLFSARYIDDSVKFCNNIDNKESLCGQNKVGGYGYDNFRNRK